MNKSKWYEYIIDDDIKIPAFDPWGSTKKPFHIIEYEPNSVLEKMEMIIVENNPKALQNAITVDKKFKKLIALLYIESNRVVCHRKLPNGMIELEVLLTNCTNCTTFRPINWLD